MIVQPGSMSECSVVLVLSVAPPLAGRAGRSGALGECPACLASACPVHDVRPVTHQRPGVFIARALPFGSAALVGGALLACLRYYGVLHARGWSMDVVVCAHAGFRAVSFSRASCTGSANDSLFPPRGALTAVAGPCSPCGS